MASQAYIAQGKYRATTYTITISQLWSFMLPLLFVLQFFSPISDSLGGVTVIRHKPDKACIVVRNIF